MGERFGRSAERGDIRRCGDLPMPGKTRARPRKDPANAVAPGAKPPPRAVQAGVDRYIVGQLKVIYDEVLAEPIPDRLMQLLDRLDDDGKN
jgi:Anti-sigma factor NepR